MPCERMSSGLLKTTTTITTTTKIRETVIKANSWHTTLSFYQTGDSRLGIFYLLP